jgi:hypothetical protein
MPRSARRAGRYRSRRGASGDGTGRGTAWRLVAVAAFAATAALAVVLAKAPGPLSLERGTPESAALSADTIACTTAGLDARIGAGPERGSAAASGFTPRVEYFTLEFTNVSHRTCVLEGYPHVDVYVGSRQVGSPATLDTAVRPRTVTLVPGATAQATLRYTGTGTFGRACHRIIPSWLRVAPPGQRAGALFPWRNPACAHNGPDFLSVQAVQPRFGHY